MRIRLQAKKTMSLTVAGVLALGCSDGQGPMVEQPLPPTPFVVSSPVPAPPSAASGVARFESAASIVVYISLPPGNVPGGRTATIRDERVGSSATVTIVDGGFDPVPLAANVGDTLAITVQFAAVGSRISYTVAVPKNAPLTVVRTSPPPHKRDVALNSIAVIVFSHPLDSATVDTASVGLFRGTEPVPGTVRFADAAHLRVEFQPDTLLAGQTDYQIVLGPGIRDVNRVALDSALTVPFTTGTSLPAMGLVFASVSVGQWHTCGVTTAGAAYCWGDNDHGALGDGTDGNIALTPVPVAGGLTFASVSAGADHTCGVTTGGAAYCWGVGGIYDSLGRVSNTPLPVPGGLTFASVSAGFVHTCGVTTAGAAYCWGEGYYGELGGNRDGSAALVPVAGGHTFAEVSAGETNSCGVTTTGVAYCWGMNTMGELGIGSSSGPELCQNGGSYACSTIPVAVAGGLTFKTVRATGAASCGVTTSGIPYCWGDNLHDLLGSGITTPVGPEQCPDVAGVETGYEAPSIIPCSTVPVKVAGGLDLAALTTSGFNYFACGLTSTGVASCWGYYPGAGPTGTTAPHPVPGGLTFATLSAGWRSTCGVTPAGVAYCWGNNAYGGLGGGTTSSSSVPVKVAGQP
jgi:alpha-tubulin suppressor-like RCC1 family protein